MKKVIIIFSIGLILFTIYANLEPKPLHAMAKATDIEILSYSNNFNENQIEALNTKIEKVKGINAFAGNSKSKIISVLFNPEIINKDAVFELLKNENIQFVKTDFGQIDSNAPQCPVPMEYIQIFNKIKYAFNFR